MAPVPRCWGPGRQESSVETILRPNQTEGATGPSHLGTGAERNSKPQFTQNRQSTRRYPQSRQGRKYALLHCVGVVALPGASGTLGDTLLAMRSSKNTDHPSTRRSMGDQGILRSREALIKAVLYQGTTLVVPQVPQNQCGL